MCRITVSAATVTQLVKLNHQDKLTKNYAPNKILCNVLSDIGNTQKTSDLGIQAHERLERIMN